MFHNDIWLLIFLQCEGDPVTLLKSTSRCLHSLFVAHQQSIELHVITTLSSEMQIVATTIMPNNILRLPSLPKSEMNSTRVSNLIFRRDTRNRIIIRDVKATLKIAVSYMAQKR